MNAATDHWAHIARRWAGVGPPLRPDADDLAAYQAAVDESLHPTRPPRVLILGVTPELFALQWPPGTSLRALDHTPAMIHAVWPGPPGSAVIGDWTAMPFDPASMDIVLCDGGWHLLPYPQGQHALADNLRRVLAPDGRFIVRLFAPPNPRESPRDMLAALHRGEVARLDEFKLRLLQALQQSPEEGVQVREAWRLVRDSVDWPACAGRAGWSTAQRATFEAYDSSPASYHFVPEARLSAMLVGEPGGFRAPRHVRAGRCPILSYARS